MLSPFVTASHNRKRKVPSPACAALNNSVYGRVIFLQTLWLSNSGITKNERDIAHAPLRVSPSPLKYW